MKMLAARPRAPASARAARRFAERYGMEIVNQLAGSLAQSASVTRQQSTDKSQQVRRAQALRKDVAAAADTFEHQVESTEELTPIHEEQKQPNGRRRQKPKTNRPPAGSAGPDEQIPRVDVTG